MCWREKDGFTRCTECAVKDIRALEKAEGRVEGTDNVSSSLLSQSCEGCGARGRHYSPCTGAVRAHQASGTTVAYGPRIERASDGTPIKVNCPECKGVYVHMGNCKNLPIKPNGIVVAKGDLGVLKQDEDEFFRQLEAETEARLAQARARIIKGFAK